MKKIGILWSMVFAVVLAGCASTQIINSYMDRNIPVREHALILIDPNISVGMIDGELQFKGSIVSPNISKMILVIPGKHSISVMWTTQTRDAKTDYTYYNETHTTTITTTTTTSDLVGFSGDFLASHIYRITAELSGNSISFMLVEENDMSIWDSKEVASVKPPKRGGEKFAVVFQRAADGNPTELEGIWLETNQANMSQSGAKEMMYTFNGSTYTLVITSELTPRQVVAMNEVRKMQGAPLLTSTTMLSGMRGMIKLKGNSITATWMQSSYDLQFWRNTATPVETKYEYSFSPEGNLLLKMTKARDFPFAMGFSVTGVLVKKEEERTTGSEIIETDFQ